MKDHILAEITFGTYPNNADETWYEEVDEAFSILISGLPRCGQILEEGIQGVINGELKAFVKLAAIDSLEDKYMSKYARKH